MHRCLQLAAYGRGRVSPNPLVGAVIVSDDRVIGEGFHEKYGGPHAEVNAIRSVKEPELLKDSTLYVNLEPCSHFGKTPPCADLIIANAIPRVVVGMKDPYHEVAGRGIGKLRAAGIEVEVGLEEDQCRELNRQFIVYNTCRRPYIVLKWAQSSDGFIDRLRSEADHLPAVRFSDDYTRLLVHKLRAEADGIMIGTRTDSLDKPQLNVRYWAGTDPVRFISDSAKPLQEQLSEMYERKIQSLIVEGGARLLSAFIAAGLWDEARIEVSSMLLGSGIEAPVLAGTLENVQNCKKSAILMYRNKVNI